jgi:hypothetical protein
MVPEEKAKYEKMAAEDRERYNHECAVSLLLLSCALNPSRGSLSVTWLCGKLRKKV